MPNLFAGFKSTEVIEKSISKRTTISKYIFITKHRQVKILSLDNYKMVYSLDGKNIQWYMENYYSSNTMLINYKKEVFNHYKRVIEEIEGENIDKILIVTSEYVEYEILGKQKVITARSIDMYFLDPIRRPDYKEKYERLLDKYISVSIVNNGSEINLERLKKFVDELIEIEVKSKEK